MINAIIDLFKRKLFFWLSDLTNNHQHGFVQEDVYRLGKNAKCRCGITLGELNNQ